MVVFDDDSDGFETYGYLAPYLGDRGDPFLHFVDHSALKIDTSEETVSDYVQDVFDHGMRGTCLRPHHIKLATELFAGEDYRNAAVIAFPTEPGQKTLASMIANIDDLWVGRYGTLQDLRLEEVDRVLEDGGNEIDMIVDLRAARAGNYGAIEREVREVKSHMGEGDLLKVITCAPYFPDNELVEISRAVIQGGADYLKTTTGFGARPAALRDLYVFHIAAEEEGSDIGFKAAGGIKNPEQAAAFYGVTQLHGPRPFIIGAGSYSLEGKTWDKRDSFYELGQDSSEKY